MLGLSLVFVFLILAALYESWSLPFSVLLSTPVAVLGAFLGLLSRQFDNNVYAQIGLVMLVGLTAKNAILIVEFAKDRAGARASRIIDAALEGARLRLRPILMTSFAFIFGCLPLWVAEGAGARGAADARDDGRLRDAGGDAARHLLHPGAVRLRRAGLHRKEAVGGDAPGRTGADPRRRSGPSPGAREPLTVRGWPAPRPDSRFSNSLPRRHRASCTWACAPTPGQFPGPGQ